MHGFVYAFCKLRWTAAGSGISLYQHRGKYYQHNRIMCVCVWERWKTEEERVKKWLFSFPFSQIWFSIWLFVFEAEWKNRAQRVSACGSRVCIRYTYTHKRKEHQSTRCASAYHLFQVMNQSHSWRKISRDIPFPCQEFTVCPAFHKEQAAGCQIRMFAVKCTRRFLIFLRAPGWGAFLPAGVCWLQEHF